MINIKFLKNSKGITSTDIIIAISVVIIFTGLVSGLFYEIASYSTSIRMNSIAIDYAVKIAEKTDRLLYDEVDENLTDIVKEELDILDSYDISILVQKYSDLDTTKKDYVKIITIKVQYRYMDKTEEYSIKKLKVREV